MPQICPHFHGKDYSPPKLLKLPGAGYGERQVTGKNLAGHLYGKLRRWGFADSVKRPVLFPQGFFVDLAHRGHGNGGTNSMILGTL